MEISVTFKNMDSSDLLKEYVEKKLSKLDRLFDKPAEARVIFTTEKDNHIAEINLSSSKLNINAKETSENMNAAIDKSVSKVKSQANKFKEKVQNHRVQRKPKEDVLEEELDEFID